MEATTIPATMGAAQHVDHFKSGVIDFTAGSLGKDHLIYMQFEWDSTWWHARFGFRVSKAFIIGVTFAFFLKNSVWLFSFLGSLFLLWFATVF